MNNTAELTAIRAIANRRKGYQYSLQENKFITTIKKNTAKYNIDNIARTKAYESYYIRNQEIKWSFLASMVSRNAGWNMTDLAGRWYMLALNWKQRFSFFYTYELANWMIFRDAFPQLLIYELSLYYNKPFFHLFKEFNVSCFMEYEWEYFWKERDEKRLVTSLIINEQNIIQEPVLENPPLKKHVFHTAAYKFQDIGHFSCVVFPTLEGKLYGYSVHGFQKLSNRIKLGKQLASLLFSECLYKDFFSFALSTEHTGSRYDYERYLNRHVLRKTPGLRAVYPIIPHNEGPGCDWVFKRGKHLNRWTKAGEKREKDYYELTKWFIHKQQKLHNLIAWKNGCRKNKG